MKKIAFIGFGEVGQRFSRDLLANDGLEIAVYDIVFDDPGRRYARLEIARAIGVIPAATAAEACRGAQVTISAVTADQAEAVARAARGFLSRGQILFDINSASPGTKRRAAGHLESGGPSMSRAP